MTSRRLFLGAASAAALRRASAGAERPALLGGKPVRQKKFPGWPVVRDNDKRGLLGALESGEWFRRGGTRVAAFEQAWAERLGARHALATNGGTTALYAALAALEVGPGDEVVVPPYTFVATVNAVLQRFALPVFADTDPETHQIDARKIEAAIGPRTRALMPVHIAGAPPDMDAILDLAKRRGLPTIEDACQAHLGEWRGRKLGALGEMGCFSFQASKNLNCGEGGCLVSNHDAYFASASAFHNNGSSMHPDAGPAAVAYGSNLRMTELQAAVLLSQMERVEEQMRRRSANAAYLDKLLGDIPGLTPARTEAGCTRHAYHLYMLRYEPDAFAGLPKEVVLRAMAAEGIPLSGGYGPLNRNEFLEKTLASRPFRAIYDDKRLNEWRERNRTPANDELCERAFWLGQTVLLGERADMEQVAEAFRKVQRLASELKAAVRRP